MDRDEVDELLAPRALSGREREQVLERVLGRVRPQRQRARLHAIALGAAAFAAGAMLVLGVRRYPRGAGGLTARGAAGATGSVEIVCAGGSLAACPRGSRLLFAIQSGVTPSFLTAYAEPVGGGERIWYFSSERSLQAISPQAGAEEPIDVSIVVGPEHAAGRYSVHVLTAKYPMSRAQATHPDPSSLLSSQAIDLVVVP